MLISQHQWRFQVVLIGALVILQSLCSYIPAQHWYTSGTLQHEITATASTACSPRWAVGQLSLQHGNCAFTFIVPSGLLAKGLAHMLHFLVRVSRRVERGHSPNLICALPNHGRYVSFYSVRWKYISEAVSGVCTQCMYNALINYWPV